MELRSILTSTKVGEVTVPVHQTLEPSDTVAAAAEEMRRQSHGSVLIWCDGKVCGIFTERDLLRVVAQQRPMTTPLSQVMTSNPRTVATNQTLYEALQMMDTGGYRRLPVVDERGAPVGFIDVKAISHFLVGYFPAAVHTQTAHSDAIAKQREGA